MATTAVEEKVKQIIVEQLGVDEGEVTANASFVDDLGADSLDTVELVMAFEEAFELEHPIMLLEPLAFVLNRMLEQLCARLQGRAFAAQEWIDRQDTPCDCRRLLIKPELSAVTHEFGCAADEQRGGTAGAAVLNHVHARRGGQQRARITAQIDRAK